MPTSQQAISRFLLYRPDPPPFEFRGAQQSRLEAFIFSIGEHEFLTRTTPRRHQLEAVAFALWARRALLFYEMRTGKTKIALDWLSHLIYSGILTRKSLIIAHAPIGADEWMSQIPFHSHLDITAITSGAGAADRFLEAARAPGVDGIVIAWSTLQQIFSVKRLATQGRRAGKEKLYTNLPLVRSVAPAFDAVVIDEIHMAGHYDTLRFGIAKELTAHCTWRLGLTGTPFGRDPLLLWAQAFLIDRGEALSSVYHFFEEAFSTKKYNHFKWSKTDYVFDHKKMPLLRDKMSAMTLHCALRDVQDIDVLNGMVRLSMTAEQREAYGAAVDTLVALRKGDTVEIDNIFVRLRQIASGYLPFTDDHGRRRIVDFPGAAKLVWLDDFLGQEPDFKFIIFHEYTHTGELLCQLLTKRKIAHEWLYGGSTDRPALLQRFRAGDSTVLVANAATGGMSIDLSAADYILFFESPASVIARKQAEARPLARGSRPLVIDDLVCAPIEQKLLDFILEGDSLRDALLRDPKLGESLRG
jgi:hypothetical protein